MQAHSTMTRKVIVVPPELSLANAWSIMTREDIRHLPVVRAGALFGMLSDRDILCRGKFDANNVFHVTEDHKVAEAMTPVPLTTCEASTDVRDIVRLMTEQKIDAVPVVRGLHLVGLVTSTDLLRLLLRGDEAQPLPFRFDLVDEPIGSSLPA